MKTTEQIGGAIIKSISTDTSELMEFIDFVKVYALALKIAFRCDRAAAWELLGIFLREFEKIGMYRRKYDESVDEIAAKIKDCSSAGTLESRVKNIVEEAEKLRGELEKCHKEAAKRLMKKGRDLRKESV